MSKMKKALSFLLISLMLIPGTLLAAEEVPSYAAEEHLQAAELLSELGLFRGSDKGFELERAPSRIEAAVMLVRLLGKEAEATATTAAHPFTDVPNWASKYIAYMFSAGLTKGTSETTFDSAALCSAQMYVTFVLRALGYDDGKGDFTYNNAITFARMENLLNSDFTKRLNSNDFIRGDMALVSYCSLLCTVKDSENLLLEKLKSEGAVPAAAADRVLGYIRAYDITSYASYLENTSATYNQEETEDILYSIEGHQPFTLKLVSQWKGSYEGALPVASSIYTSTNWDGEKNTYTVYFSDGHVYIKDYSGTKTKMDLDFYNKLNELDSMIGPPVYSTVGMFSKYSSCSVSEKDGKVVITRTLSERGALELALYYIESVFENLDDYGGDEPIVLIRAASQSYIFHEDGYMESYTETLDFDYMGPEDDKCTVSISVKGKNAEPGTPVSIELPSFSGYTEAIR